MSKKPKLKALASAPVAQSREEVVAAVAEIGRLQRERTRIETEMNDTLAQAKADYETIARPATERIAELAASVQAWCEAHRNELTDGGKTKTATLETGEVKWRMTPGSVSLRAVDVIIATLKKRGLDRFIRTKEEVNKEAILADPNAVAGVAGITISQREEFLIEPFETQIAEGVA
jgi:phage host-nuclease inhibitor protein Gam